MSRKPQYEILVDYLRKHDGKATIRDIHIDTWINNVPDAKMQARKKGFNITTEHLHSNKKIASYMLHEFQTVDYRNSEPSPGKTVRIERTEVERDEKGRPKFQPLFPDFDPPRTKRL